MTFKLFKYTYGFVNRIYESASKATLWGAIFAHGFPQNERPVDGITQDSFGSPKASKQRRNSSLMSNLSCVSEQGVGITWYPPLQFMAILEKMINYKPLDLSDLSV